MVQVIGGAPSLDTMLGDLQENMSKQGVRLKQKGVCGACGKPIVGQVVTALGRTWHPECFTCAECNQVRLELLLLLMSILSQSVGAGDSDIFREGWQTFL